MTFEITQTVTAFDRPSRYAFGADRPIRVAYDFRFTEEGDGTRVTSDMEADPGRFLPGGSLLLRGRFRKEFEGDMARLEARLATQ